MLSVTMGVSAEVLDSALSGGNPVNNAQVSLFQFFLGAASIIIFLLMKRLNRNLSSPTITAELLGWKLDIVYSLCIGKEIVDAPLLDWKLDIFYSYGMSLAFFLSRYLEKTPLGFITPYFDQIVAVLVMVFMLPESIKVLWSAVRDIFLFSPDEEFINEIKALCGPVLEQYRFSPVFFDITRTGRHLWVAIYFKIETGSLKVQDLSDALDSLNEKAREKFQECTCELILVP